MVTMDRPGVVMARLSVPRSAASGLALGLAWGIAARTWMRLISTDPEFSWTGTGFILGATAVGGLAFGLMYGTRQAGRSRWWRLLAAAWLPTLAGPGMVFLPTLFFGGLLFGSKRTRTRAVGGTAVLSGAIMLWLLTRSSGEPVNQWKQEIGFLLLALALAAGSAEIYRPRPRQSQAAGSRSSA